MNDLKLVPLKDLSEWDAYQTATALAFGEIADQARLDRTRGCFEPERAVQVEDGELIVATAGGRSFELTVPGGSRIPTGGLTAVSVFGGHARSPGGARRSSRRSTNCSGLVPNATQARPKAAQCGAAATSCRSPITAIPATWA